MPLQFKKIKATMPSFLCLQDQLQLPKH